MVEKWTIDFNEQLSVKNQMDFFHEQICSFIFRAHVTTVEYVIDQAMEFDDEGLYICNVSSASGFEVAEIEVDVLGKFQYARGVSIGFE